MSGRFGSDDRETVSAQPNKRRRVALACSNCRHRKSRCDGRRPKCSLCCELGCECLYEHAGTTTSLTVGRSYLDRLEKRLKDIETSLKTVQDNQASSIHESTSEQRRSGTRCDTRNSEDSVGSARVDGSLLYQNNGGFGEIDNAEDSVDGMGAIKFTDEEDWGYFGPSSNISFLRHISLAMARAGDLTQAFPSPVSHAREISGGISVSRPHHVESDRNTRTFHGSVNIYALPSESRTWALIKEYFQKTGQLLPFVHEESFCTAYFEMKKKNFTMVRRTWLGLLNIILACATTLHVDSETTTEKRIEESDLYYQRANGLCDKESRRTISVELVQYLLILGQYLQSTQKSVLAWTVHGLAITTAFQLGLPSPKTNKGFPPLECEIRKRVWFGCVLLDRTLSMTFGRPSMIPEKYLKLDMPLSNLQMVGQPLMPVLAPQMDAMFFTATIKLYNVMHQVIDTCYGQNLGLEEYHTEAEIIPLVLKGEEQLDEWKSQLTPLQMRVYDAPISSKDLEKMDLENKITERFLMVLSVRYHNLQILLHRPILEKFLETCVRRSSGERGMVQQLGINGIETCVNSAVISISIVHTVVCSEGWRRDLLGAWNYSLFYTFNAGLVIFAAMHIARNNVRSDVKRASQWDFMEQALPYFKMAIEALENLDRGNRVIERCVSYLSQLSTTSLGSESLGSSLNEGQPNGNANVHHSEDGLSPPMNRSQYHSFQQDYTGRMASSARMGNPGIAPRQVPVEIDLNEFMLDTDLDFFGRQFNVGTYDQAFQ